MTFSSSAERGRFQERRLPNDEVQKILQRGADTVNAIDAVRRQDLQNRQAFLQATKEKAQVESDNRKQNFDLEAQNRQRIIEQERRNAEQRARNAEIQGDQSEKIFASLAGFSQTATKLYQQYQEKKAKQEWDDEFNKALLGDLPPEQQLEAVNERYTAQMVGVATDTQADVARALGANIYAQESLRGLNKNRKQARLYAYSVMAGEKWYGYAMEQLSNNKKDRYKVINEKGETVEITPSQASTSDLQEQVLRQMAPQYMAKYGLQGLKPAFLTESIQNIRKGTNLILGETKKGEVSAARENRISLAKDTLFDLRTPQAFHEAYESLRHEEGGDKFARAETLKLVFTARNENGNFQFSDIEVDNILNSPFLHQPGQSIRGLYSNEIEPLFRLREQAAIERYQTDRQKEEIQNDQWADQVRDYINKNPDKLSDQNYDQLIETAKRNNNSRAAAMIADLKSFGNEAKNDKMYEQIWQERMAEGLPISREEVARAKISNKMKIEYMGVASKSEATAVPQTTLASAKTYIEQKLRERVDVAIGGKVDATFGRAKDYAMAQYRRDFIAEMQRSNDPGKADQYALGRFQQIFGQEGGQYAKADQFKNESGRTVFQANFPNFRVKPTAPKVPATYNIIKSLKADPNAIDSKPLIPAEQLQKAYDQASRGQRISIPPLAQYIADQTGGQMSVIDIMNRQAKAQNIQQIPLQSYERAQQIVSPEFQQLLNYRPSPARTDRAMISSGQPAVYQASKPLDSVMGMLVKRGLKRDEAILMGAIMMAESGGDASVVRNRPDTGDLSYGLFQINMIDTLGPARMRQFGLKSYDDLKNPDRNVDAAIAILRGSGLTSWGAYGKGDGPYKQFMGQARAAYDRLAAQNSGGGGNPWRSPGYVNPDVIEYITGDRTHPNYRADHGGDNKHEHIAFRSRRALEKAKAELVSRGYRISSERGGKHAPNSYHYQGLAIDVAPPFSLPRDKRSEREWSEGVRRIVGIS